MLFSGRRAAAPPPTGAGDRPGNAGDRGAAPPDAGSAAIPDSPAADEARGSPTTEAARDSPATGAAPDTGPHPVLALVGPTASGKSEAAVRLAFDLPFPVEIVSCDAFQIYRGLTIGAGVLPATERRGVPHHLLGVLAPDDPATAGRYADLAAARLREIRRRGATPLVVGGSGLYFRALREGLFAGPRPEPELRQRLARISSRRRGGLWLGRLLARLDPEAHRRIHPGDRVRRARALEVALLAGSPISEMRRDRRPPLPEARWRIVGLDPPREVLAARIARRVRAMFASGLVEEAAALERRFGDRWPGRGAIGYREVLAALAEPPSDDRAAAEPAPEAVPEPLRDRLRRAESQIVTATRRYAKRQRTWFRAERGVVWLREDPEAPSFRSALLAAFTAPEGSVASAPGGNPPGRPAPRSAS